MVKEPTVAVPVSVMLELCRIYNEEPFELRDNKHHITVRNLEQKAYRKWKSYRKELKGKLNDQG